MSLNKLSGIDSPGAADNVPIDVASALLSDEAMSIIQKLQNQLVRTSWHIREAEETANKRLLAVEEQHVHLAGFRGRQHEDASKLSRLEQEQEEEARHRSVLSERLTKTQEELLEARESHSLLVAGKDATSLREEIERLRVQLAVAQEEGQGLRVRLEDSKNCRQKRIERSTVSHQEADIKRQREAHSRAARMASAKQLSAKAVQEQKLIESKLLADRCSQLSHQKSRLESDIQSLFKQNSGLEQRMETLRNRNRQLEIQLKKQQSVEGEKEAVLREELQKLMTRLRVMSDVMQLPAEPPTDALRIVDRDDDYIGSGVPSTATSPAPSAYASSSSLAGVWSSKRSLAPTYSAEGLNEQGNQMIEATSSASLSQAASQALAESPMRADAFREDGVNATLGSSPEMEAIYTFNPESRESSMARTQMLVSEIQGWSLSAK